jgi:hypothetical protein
MVLREISWWLFVFEEVVMKYDVESIKERHPDWTEEWSDYLNFSNACFDNNPHLGKTGWIESRLEKICPKCSRAVGCHEMDEDRGDHDTLDCGYSLKGIFDSR